MLGQLEYCTVDNLRNSSYQEGKENAKIGGQ
jgi:hypothetical protein